MAQREFRPAGALLPKVLARLTRETGRAAYLVPVWGEAVGALVAKHSTPLFLEGRTLIVEVESPRWKVALEGMDDKIRSRLCERMGEGAVEKVVYRSRTAK